MRSKGLTVLLVIPYFFMLRKYFAVARTRALIHVYVNGLERGYLKFFGYNKKHWIYNYGQKTWFYSPKVTPDFHARFWVWSEKFLDHNKINKIKEAAMKSITEKEEAITLTPKEVEILPFCFNNSFHSKNESAKWNVANRFIKKYERAAVNN